ncbi:MAG: lysM domain protein, partial [Betaproteobacteria bacterium]|nr:lysM domain protein [Betaproteobacteria bacterium]
MHSKTILPAVLLLTSACAQLPNTPGENLLGESQGVAQVSAPRTSTPPPDSVVPAAPQTAAPAAPAPRSAPAIARKTPLQPPSAAAAATVDPVAPLSASAPAADDAPPASVWTRVRGGFAMAPLDNDLVRDWENWYANRPE